MLLKAFKGLGDVGVDIFFREVQSVWDELYPFADERAIAGARRLGLSDDRKALARLTDRREFPRLAAALVRVDLARDEEDAIEAARRRSWRGGCRVAGCAKGRRRRTLRAMDVTVRDAEGGDAPAIGHLLDQLGYPSTPSAVERRLRHLAASEADDLLVALARGDVVGLAGLHVSAGIEHDGLAGKVSALVVDERFRRRGVGEALIAAVERRARERGCVLLFLTTAERRKGAHEFYRRVGFHETGRRFAKSLA